MQLKFLLFFCIIQQKKEMLQRNRLIQQASLATNPDCLSPEPIIENKSAFSKCQSSSNIPVMSDELEEKHNKKMLSKSISGGNINSNTNNDCVNNERGSTSSASGVSSPSNNSHREDEEK